MYRSKVINSLSQLKSQWQLAKRCVPPNARFFSTSGVNLGRYDLEFDRDEPIKYSTSEAANWIPSAERQENAQKYNNPPVATCFIIFMVYFGILREPNDLDEIFEDKLSPEMHTFIFGTPEEREQLAKKMNEKK